MKSALQMSSQRALIKEEGDGEGTATSISTAALGQTDGGGPCHASVTSSCGGSPSHKTDKNQALQDTAGLQGNVHGTARRSGRKQEAGSYPGSKEHGHALQDAPDTGLQPDTCLQPDTRRSCSSAVALSRGQRTEKEFQATLDQVRQAIRAGIHPKRIEQGSSGSYFCRNMSGDIVGVFKPKNEEPYGKLNPKWTKWLHKTCLPCCFGRSCLIPNLGYISEAAASIVDQSLQLNIVPCTKVVKLAAPSFNYGPIARRRCHHRRQQHPASMQTSHRSVAEQASIESVDHGHPDLPPKIGSFQIFLKGYKDSSVHLRRFQEHSLSPALQRSFQEEFEKLVILDYLIRNTDRGDDNWMIYYGEGPHDVDDATHTTAAASPTSATASPPHTPAGHAHTEPDGAAPSPTQDATTRGPHVRIAGIDNGLAFPFKHPDNWRSYPYGWSSLAAARRPFSDATRQDLLHRMDDPSFWPSLRSELTELFATDHDFDGLMWRRQMAVLYGQLSNIMDTLREPETRPLDLLKKPLITMYDEGLVLAHETSGLHASMARRRDQIKTFVKAQPCFSWC